MKKRLYLFIMFLCLISLVGCGKKESYPEATKDECFVIEGTTLKDYICYPHILYKGDVISDVVIPKGITVIGERAFEKTKITSVVIPDTVTEIQEFAFMDNLLTSITIPNGVKTIKYGAFINNQLTDVTISDSVEQIEGDSLLGAFENNKIKTLKLGKKLQKIGGRAFKNNMITNLEIPDSVTSIGNFAFFDNELATLKIGKGMTRISGGVFAKNKLTTVEIPDNIKFIENSVTGLNGIGTYGAFQENQITSLSFGKNIETIGWDAFVDNKLTTVKVPKSLINEVKRAFDSNVKIESIEK